MNPQLTVMGLAEYAARSLLEAPAPRIGRAAPDHGAYGAGVSSRSGSASATAVTLRSAFESART